MWELNRDKGSVPWPFPPELGEEGHHHPLTAHSKPACAAAPALDTKLSPAPANDIISKEAGSDPWLSVQAAAG